MPVDAAVLDQNYSQVPPQCHVVDPRLQLQQSLGTLATITWTNDHQEASAPRHKGQSVIIDSCNSTEKVDEG